MTSRFGQRAAGIAAAAAIVLLVVLIALLWTGVGQELFQPSTSGFDKHVRNAVARQNTVGVISDSDFRTTYSRNEALTTVSDATRPQEIRLPAPSASSKAITEKSREYVKPIKISPLGLHEDDLLYGSDQLQGGNIEPVQLRHHSGHFRHKTANIWDPHPTYEFTAFQKKFHLVLQHDSGFASPDLQVTHIWHNSSARGLPNIKSNGCFYKGYVKGDPSSSVAVSLCHGMTGRIQTSTGNYFIEPSEQSSDHAKPIEHVIYEMTAIGNDGKDFHHCGLVDDYEPAKIYRRHESDEIHSKHDSGMVFDYDTDYSHHNHQENPEEEEDDDDDDDDEEDTEEDFDNTTRDSSHKNRSKRSSQEYFVEILVVADSTMARYHGSGVENYILALMYIVSGIFKDASIGNPITIALVKLEILYDRNFAHHRYPPHNGVSAADMLREFCRYQASTNTNNEDSVFHHDTALLLTRENICRNASAHKCETLGLAELGTMCDRKSSCSLVQDNGLSAAFTIAHELGHVLNMPHDDAELKCAPHTTTDSISHVMSTSLKEGTDPWSWSECSRHFITEFLESRHSDCLKDPPIKDYITENVSPDVLPGEKIVGNRQCELLYGEGSHVCSYMPVCSALWCNKIGSDGCQTLHMPWGDGTPCGDGEWCQKGVCVKKNRKALKKVDGGWGSWQGFGPCSRTCGGGVKKSYRDCDNPRPQNGGRYCIGSRVRYKSCGARDCPEGTKGFREAQCSAFDNNNHNIHGVPSTVKWVPKYGLLNDDRCILYCRVYHTNMYYPLKDKVIDGTPCAFETFDICVNGQCKPAGCDHILSSGVQLDQCGKCGGRNDTCRLIKDYFNEPAKEQGYRTVVRIPAGSSNLDIRQHGMNGMRDDNYLVLKDGVTGGRLLNNENVLTTFRKFIYYDGVTLEYSGCLTEVERINASRPLRRDLLVEVLSAGNLSPPNIIYQYTVPTHNDYRYIWKYLDQWESCDQVCNGIRRRKIVCATVETNQIVDEVHCDVVRKPTPMTEPCNTNCVLKWRITGRTECSSHCGRGTRKITKECVQEIAGHRHAYPLPSSSCLHLHNHPPDIEECEGPCNSANWKYGEWSTCSKTCGSGIQRREAYCVDELDRPMSEDTCDPQERITEKVCEPQSCPTWSYGEWSACSVTCGTGFRTRGHWCQHDNQVIDMSYCNASSMPKHEEKCVMPPCRTSWQFSEWSPCSVTCDEGIRRRSVHCKTDDGNIVEEVMCRHHSKPSSTELTESCRQPRCFHSDYNSVMRDDNSLFIRGPTTVKDHRLRISSAKPRWVTYDWKECSTTCGSGTQHRTVRCLSPSGEESHVCPFINKPPTTQFCHVPCHSHTAWVEGDWGQCSQTCGTGIQQRQVICQSRDGKFLRDEYCIHLGPKPPVQQACRNYPCTSKKKYQWKPGPWSSCSKTCGTGEKTRQVRCTYVVEDNNEIDGFKNDHPGHWVDDSFCDRQNRRKDKKKCTRKLCAFSWIAGEWGECSRRCGEGIQNRTVTCHRVNSYNWLDPIPLRSEGFCDINDRPPLTRICNLRDCNSPVYWKPEEWQPCSQPCGKKGIQKREYTCRGRDGRILRKRDCKDLPKPLPKTKPCNRRLCGLSTCTEVQLQTNARSDGEYLMLVGGKNMSIYCKGMNTNSPKEYLTLVHPEENYSEFYDKRLKNADTCPYNGVRNDSCECYSESENKYGVTIFDKVRLLVETLEIQTQDFTFTRRIKGRLIGLGEAGDCYSSLQNCPQGNFRINLEGTSLEIPNSQQWVGKTVQTTLSINRENPQRIFGKCGGSCGSCGPSTSGRLKLHVVPP